MLGTNFPWCSAWAAELKELFAAYVETKQQQKHAIIYELCHVVTDPFYGKATDRFMDRQSLEDERETLTDHIAMIVLKNGL